MIYVDIIYVMSDILSIVYVFMLWFTKNHSSRSLCPKARDGHFLRQLRRRLQEMRGSDVGNLEARSSGAEDWKQLQCPTYSNLIQD